jgi:C1A family cysteine protease
MPAGDENRVDGLRTRTVKGYGWIPDIPDARDLLFSAPDAVLAELPSKVDLRADCPPVYDQGHLGSCTANAIGAAFEYDVKKQGGQDLMPSRLFIYYNERAVEGSIDTDSGAMIRDGIKGLGKLGVCPEAMWPYDIAKFRDKPTDECYKDALEHQALVYRRVRHERLHQLQGALASGTPVVFGFAVYDSFESQEVARTGEVPMPNLEQESLLGGHAVLAVGYDDQTRRFLVRNSWGTGWGMDGYCTMPYDYLTDRQLAQDFWAIYTVEQ